MSASKGILYVATGERYVAEAMQSARSAKRQMPDIPICLFTDKRPASTDAFDEIRIIENPRHFFADKVQPMLDSPYERTLFLDTDTLVCHSVEDVFQLLDRFDVAIAHAPMRHDRAYPTPNCFVEMNSGVIAYHKNAAVEQMFRCWIEIYEKELKASAQPEIGDQVHLRQAIYESAVSLYILPPEYNFRSVMPGFCARQKVRILHGRGDLESIAQTLNATNKLRVSLPSLDFFNSDQVLILDKPGKLFMKFFGGFVELLTRCRGGFRKHTGL
ncbi:MAG: hypothetical protein ABIP97_11755 [Chthoniobacterales bacterium]